MTRVKAMQVSIDAPGGWEIEIDGGAHRPDPTEGAKGKGSQQLLTTMARIHAANFALPPERGDFGSGAVERMRSGDILLCVLEEDSAMAATSLYATEGLPTFTAADFDPNRMQRPIKGQSGAQAFFHIEGRAFVAYAVLGSHLDRHHAVVELNRVMASLDLR